MATDISGFAALADPTRREVFERLAARPSSVGELAAGLPVSRPAVSQHLRVLKDARLVADEAVGTRRVYRADPEGLAMLREYLDLFWRRSLDSLASVAEETFHDHPDPT
ncbi:ArsR/SmtB family transcription factor [Isoptericola variabilis]|uniref:ArsR/SmtB family transcription factor n=1 Tax=Isoptericola variabilis TaxID=139208 RepID=UPI003D1E7C68